MTGEDGSKPSVGASRRPIRSVGLIVAMAVAYHVTAQASLLLAIPPGFASPVWPSAGIGFVGVLRYGYRLWPGVLLGSFSINLLVSGGLDDGITGGSVLTASSIGVGATLQAVLATYLVRRFVDPRPRLVGGAQIGRFFALGGPVACLVNSLVGATTLVGVGTIPGSEFLFTWWTWWTGDVIGVMTMAPILLSVVGTPRDEWRARRRSVAVPLCLMLVLLGSVFVMVRRSEARRQRDEFAVRARALALAFQRDIDAHLGVVEAVAHACAHVDHVTPAEFVELAEALRSRAPGIRALRWTPRVPGAGEGAYAYRVPSAAPSVTSEDAAAGGVSTEGVLRAALDRARDTGVPTLLVEPAATGAEASPPGLVVLVPAFEGGAAPEAAPEGEAERRRRLLGHAVGVLDVAALVDASLRGSPIHHVRVLVRDQDTPSASPLLSRAVGEGLDFDDPAPPPEGEHATSPIDWAGSLSVADHTWRVEIGPSAAFFAASRPWSVWLVAAGGLFVTGLLGAFLLFLTGQTQRIQHEVAVQTEQLARANAALQQEVAEREQTEIALRTAKDAAESATRAKSQFLARMSHEIRTPMNAIMGMTELVLDTELSAEQRESLETVSHAGGVLGRLLDDILDFSKVEVGKIELRPEIFSLHRLLQRLEQVLSARLRQAELELHVDIAPQVPARLYGDPDRLTQVFINLLSNAMKFTDPGGEIEVRVAATRGPEGSVKLHGSVADTGIGISERDQQRIFGSFEQGDGSSTRRHGGTGLGLAITAHLVGLMGGRLQVSSVLGRGSTFDFTVTLSEPPADAPDRDEPADPEPSVVPPGPLRILLAEDNPVNQQVAEAMLAGAGHDVVIVDDGRQAVERCASDRFDVILMDIQMPVMDGIEAVEAIRAHERASGLSPVPIIALTAHAVHDEMTTRVQAMVDGYVTKPITRKRLWEALIGVLGAAPVDEEQG